MTIDLGMEIRESAGSREPNGGREASAASLRQVTEFVHRFDWSAVPETVFERAGLLLLDTLGIAVAATPMDAGRIARDVAEDLYAAGSSKNAARILFDGRRVSMAGAAYAAATAIDNLDGHDGYNPTKGHIGVVAVPALTALAESRADLSGRDALANLITGYEVAGRAAISLHATVSDYHTSGAWNGLGVVAMAAQIRAMSDDATRQALGIAEFHGPRSQMMREIDNPTMLHDGSGWGALVGFSSAVLAEHGFTGAPAITLEAPDVAQHWEDLGRFWQVEQQYIKPYPICRWAHAAIDAARELCIGHGVSADQVDHIHISTFAESARLFQTMPDSTSKAQYSLPFAVATMIAHGRIGLEHISGSGLTDVTVAALVARTTVIEEPRHSARFPLARWADVELRLTDGRVLHSGDVHARGGPERPYGANDITNKFMEFAAPVIGDTRAAAIRDAALGLTDPGRPFSDLAQHLYEPVQ